MKKVVSKSQSRRIAVQKEESKIVLTMSPAKERYDFLQTLYKILQEEGIRSISDLENKIAQAEKAL